jgi:hypothetical protein
MYPKSQVTGTAVMNAAFQAAKIFLRKDIGQRETGLHRLVPSRSHLDNNQALLARTREVLEGAGLTHLEAKAALAGTVGNDLVYFYRKELSRSTDVWDADLTRRIDMFDADTRAGELAEFMGEYHMPFLVLQKIIGKKSPNIIKLSAT